MSFSKSIFTNSIMTSNTRSVINPVSIGSGGCGSDYSVITSSYYNTLKIIETLYGSNMANKNYESIPNDFNKVLISLKLVDFHISLPPFCPIGTILKDSSEVLRLKSYSSPSPGFSVS